MLSCLLVSDFWGPMDCSPPGSSVHGDSPSKNTGVGCPALLQRIFPVQGRLLSFLHFPCSICILLPPQLFRFSCCVSAILQTNTSCKLLMPIKNIKIVLYSVQFSCLVVSDFLQPKDCSTQPGLPVHHQLPEFTQTHVHWVSGAIQPSHQWHSKTSSVTLPVFWNKQDNCHGSEGNGFTVIPRHIMMSL